MEPKNSKNKLLFHPPLLIIFLIFALKIGLAANLKVKVTAEEANIRLKPDINSHIIAKVAFNTVLESEGKVGSWYRVNLRPDESGFVISGYIHENMVEVVEKIKEVPKEEKAKEKEPPEVTPPAIKEQEIKKERPLRIEEKRQVTGKESTKKFSFRAGLGIAIPSGDWADLFNLGLGVNVGNSFSIFRQPMFDLDLIGSAEAFIFFRKAGYTDISWTRISLAGDCRLNLKLNEIKFFGQGGLGLYLDILEITTWWWKEEASEFRIGPRISGGIGFRNLEIMAIYHLVEDNMFTIMGSVIIKF